MLNIILILIITNILINSISKSKEYLSVLQCGIWGYHGTTKKRLFQWSKFDILGIHNDERGGDACGRYSGDLIEHNNSNVAKKYKEYIKLYYPPKLNNQTGTIIGHARKSSYFHGADDSIHLTQPIVRWDEEANKITNVLVHNGTIYNDKELLRNFNAPETFRYKNKNKDNKVWFSNEDTNDSNIIGDILFNTDNPEDVLKAYRGTASLVWYDASKDRLFMFAGESRNHKHGVGVFERPLYYMVGNDHVWFSSIEDPLLWIRHRDEDTAAEVPKNTLITFESGILVDEVKIDRSESSQSQSYNPNVHIINARDQEGEYGGSINSLPAHYNKPKVGDFISLTIAGIKTKVQVIYDGNDQCSLCKGTGENIYVDNLKCRTCHGTGQSQAKGVNKNLTVAYSNLNTSKKKEKYKAVDGSIILSEKIPDYDSSIIKFARLRYWDKQSLAHGLYHLTPLGEKKDKKVEEGEKYKITKPYYFVKGIMLEDHEVFQNWSRKISKKSKDINQEYLEELAAVATHPVTSLENEFVMVEGDKSGDWDMAEGSINPLFSRMVYKFEKAECLAINHCQFGLNTPRHESKSERKLREEKARALREKEKKIKEVEEEINNDLLSDGIVYNDDFENDESYEKMIKTDISEEFSSILQLLGTARDSVSQYSNHKFGIQAHDLIDDLYAKTREFGESINSGLPF